jgi:predicted metalloprotease with PDZ domain
MEKVREKERHSADGGETPPPLNVKDHVGWCQDPPCSPVSVGSVVPEKLWHTPRVVKRPAPSLRRSDASPLRSAKRILGRAVVIALLATVSEGAEPLEITLDARETPRKILHAELRVPVTPGPMTLVYPKWIPGEHGPNGPIADLANLRFHADGRALAWQRDDVDMFAFHVNVPPGTHTLQVFLDFLLPPEASGFSSGASASSRLGVLSWNQVLLYPLGPRADALPCVARLRLPKDWSFATALPVKEGAGDGVEFLPVSLATLVDSPVLAGRYMRTFDLSPGSTPKVFLHVAADQESALAAKPEAIDGLRRLVNEAGALFGARHYSSYHFLYTLSDHVAHFGLEHHESSDDRDAEKTFVNDALFEAEAGLLPHEFVHSWNGKYRRPAGLVTPDFQQPMKGELLWVYEGLTEYLGDVLTARTGLWTQEQYRENLARVVGELDHRPGRAWRPLLDTAVEAQILFQSRADWASLRRSTDFYDEGELVWLEVDVAIRKLTGGKRSLDDFCKSFFGGPSGPPSVSPYTMADVTEALGRLAPQDWTSFFASRIESVELKAPTGGIEGAGWRVRYEATFPELLKARDEYQKTTDLTSSIGGTFKEDGTVVDVIPGMVLDRAGLGPGMKVTAISGQRFSSEGLRQALGAALSTKEPILLMVENDGEASSHALDYHEGEKYPRLERDPSLPDLLSSIVAPLVKPRSRAATTRRGN